jgi:diacylglycerol O-acyltransferase / wax synthase
MNRMSRLDAGFWFAETRECPMHGIGVRVCDPSGVPDFSFETVRDLVAAHVEELPSLRYRVVGARLGLDRPWLVEDPAFDINMHVRRIALPPPGGRRELQEAIGRLLSRQLDRARPLWEMWFIEGLARGRVATVVKIHHALVDGVSGAALIERMYDTSPQPRSPVAEAGPPAQEPVIPNLGRRALGALVNVGAVTPYRTLRAIQQTVSQRVAGRGLANKPPRLFQAPHTRFNAAISPRRQVSCCKVSVDRISAVRRAYGVTFNDVLLALVSGAARRYLQDRGELPERPLVAQVPMSTRSDITELGNMITTVSIRLPTDVADPVERMKTTAVSAQSAKNMAAVLSAHRVVGRTEVVPPGLLHLGVRAYAASHLGGRFAPINLVVSNGRGSDTPHHLAGAVVEEVVVMGPIMLDVALNVTCYTYNGWANLGFVTTPEIAGDIDELADAIDPCLQELEEAAARLVVPT